MNYKTLMCDVETEILINSFLNSDDPDKRTVALQAVLDNEAHSDFLDNMIKGHNGQSIKRLLEEGE